MMTNSKGACSARAAHAVVLFGILFGGSACGQTSFFDVMVTVKQVQGVTQDSLRQINSCQVTVSGASSDAFPLDNCVFGLVQSFAIGTFQYGTDKDSGTVNFQVDLIGQDRRTVLGSGTGGAAIKSGGRQTLAVEVVPDPTKFNLPQ